MLSTPYQTTYYPPAAKNEKLNVLIYIPHGGEFETFMDQNRERLERIFWLEEEFLRELCVMEADTFTPELAHKMAQILASEGLRVAIMEVLYPREILDLNRNLSETLRPVFDHLKHNQIKDLFLMAYRQVLEEHERLRAQLAKHGREFELHSMRPGKISSDLQPAPKIRLATDSEVMQYGYQPEIRQYFETRRTELLAQNEVKELRDHCLVVHHGETREEARKNMIANPELVEHTKDLFGELGIRFTESEAYFLMETIMREGGEKRYRAGILIDLVKTALCQEKLGKDFDLRNLTADEAQMNFYAQTLAAILLKAFGREIVLPEKPAQAA